MLRKIIEWFYPFSYDADKFVLKHKPTYYSGYYRHVYYSGNGGKSFRKLLVAKPPLFSFGYNILTYDWSFDYFTFNIEDTSFQSIRERFTSLKEIEDYMEKEYSKFLEGKKEVAEKRKTYIKKLENNCK